jgi:hypothetical protein
VHYYDQGGLAISPDREKKITDQERKMISAVALAHVAAKK